MNIDVFLAINEQQRADYKQQKMDVGHQLEVLTHQWSNWRAQHQDATGNSRYLTQQHMENTANLNKYYELVQLDKQPASQVRYFTRYIRGVMETQFFTSFMTYDAHGNPFAIYKDRTVVWPDPEYRLSYNSWHGDYMVLNPIGVHVVAGISLESIPSAMHQIRQEIAMSHVEADVVEGILRANLYLVKAK
jgi:hypothetical protein